jgi:hypothetical protein
MRLWFDQFLRRFTVMVMILMVAWRAHPRRAD